MCSGPLPTEGLVGFLSGKSTGGKWVDEYLGVNATVMNGAAAGEKWGVTFSGAGAGAEWPVGKLGQNQPYYFANNEFTLVATVTIHAVPEEDDAPLLGVRMNDSESSVLFGLSYTKDKKWRPTLHNTAAEEPCGETWDRDTTYQVAVKMNTDDDWNVYVDGREIYEGEYAGALFDSHRISHFYFGGDGAEGAEAGPHVTVANVLLYNEALTSDEIRKLARSKVALGGTAAGKESRELQAVPPASTSEGGESVAEVEPEVGRGEQQTEDGERTEGQQEQKDAAAVEAPAREERLPAVLGSGGASVSPQQPANAAPPVVGAPTVGGEQSHEAEAGSAGDPAPRKDDAGAPDPRAAQQSSDVEAAPAPPAVDSPLSPSVEHHQEEKEVQPPPAEEGAATQLSQGADKETGDVAAPSNGTPNSDAEEAEEAADKKEKKDEEEGATEGGGGALAPPPLKAPAAASAPRPGAAEQAVGAETSERQRGSSPPADGAVTAAPVGDATPRSGPMDDGQAQQTPPSHAPEAVGGVPSASAAPTGETPNAAAEGSGADPQTAADVDGGHEAPSNAATAPAAQAPGQPGTPPTRDAASYLSNNSITFKNTTGPFPMNTGSDGAVRGCVSRLLLLALPGLWGATALC
ncbi:trans-sialidase [Trypanosoma conorhini]|uniref:Trans-sialidase n=1 Tax=Trypanosoma conorhini TaxID=83891 RepID=A0A422N3T0_9TRYP|nr:trans-sialidase [Trypanosoma conorhini]RNF00104.1 trans-sialidase [Trypanosoma conorhini]